MSIECPLCSLEDSNTSLLPITIDNPEYMMASKTNDGTKKWYSCSRCGGTFCKDKLRNKWQYSPATYTAFIEKGIIADKLEPI